MTSTKPRRYLSRVVHVGLLFHGHHLPLHLTEPTVTQYSPRSPFFPITTGYHLKTFTTPPSPLLAVPVHPSTTTVPITVLQPQTKIHTYAQPTNLLCAQTLAGREMSSYGVKA